MLSLRPAVWDTAEVSTGSAPPPLNIRCLTETPKDYGDYGKLLSPHPIDDEIVALLREVEASDRFPELIGALTPRVGWEALWLFARRAATFAVRRRDPELLRAGLVAIGVASRNSLDYRDELVALAMLWHSAGLLDLDAEEEVRAAAAKLPLFVGTARHAPPSEAEADRLTCWLERSPRSQSLAVMGLREGKDKSGFRYVQHL